MQHDVARCPPERSTTLRIKGGHTSAPALRQQSAKRVRGKTRVFPRFVETALAVETNKGGLGENGVFPQKGMARREKAITTRPCFIDMLLPLQYKIVLLQVSIHIPMCSCEKILKRVGSFFSRLSYCGNNVNNFEFFPKNRFST